MTNVAYTEEMTVQLTEAYTQAQTDAARDQVVEEFAIMFGKSVASIRGKLSREGVYVKKTKKASGTRGMKKAELVHAIGTMLEIRQDLESLEKANLNDLRVVMDALVALNNRFELKD